MSEVVNGTTASSVVEADPCTMDRILKNALEHFSRFGYAGASVREITQASQVTKPTLYYYFKNKEELYSKLSQTCFESLLSNIQTALSIQGSTKDRLFNLMREYARLSTEKMCELRFVHLMISSAERNAPDVGIHRYVDSVGDYVRKAIQEGVAKNEVNAVDVESITFATLALAHFHISGLLIGYQPKANMETIKGSIALLLKQ